MSNWHSRIANADGIGFGSNTEIADIDVVIARREIITGQGAERDVIAAGGVEIEREFTVGRVCGARVLK